MEIFLPNYQNCIVNITVSLMNYFGANSHNGSNKIIDDCLKQDYKNIILLTLDGMGNNFVNKNMIETSFIRKHLRGTITSVYPCTTTAATTSINTGLNPSEHGWLGWNSWFKEYGAIVDLFLDRDSLSGAAITPSPAKKYLSAPSAFCLIQKQVGNKLNCRSVMPPFAVDGVNSFEAMAARILKYCQEPGKQLINAYWYEPDTLMHKLGPDNETVIEEIHRIDGVINNLYDQLKDTLMVITADHGQTNIIEELFLDDIPELMNCLILPPSLENRAASFFVKSERREHFEQMFADIFHDDYLLLNRSEVYSTELFGPGRYHPKIDDFLGDYLACATGNKMLRFIGSHDRERYYFKGHHAGLTEDEMIVPLIVAAC